MRRWTMSYFKGSVAYGPRTQGDQGESNWRRVAIALWAGFPFSRTVTVTASTLTDFVRADDTPLIPLILCLSFTESGVLH